MQSSKYSPGLQLALKYQNLGLTKSFVGTTGITDPNIWQVIVTARRDITYIAEELGAQIQPITQEFSVFTLDKEKIKLLGDYPIVQYVELPYIMDYIIDTTKAEICALNISGSSSPFDVTGKGTIIGIIDSGIDYTHPDFINPDGTSRILYLWDQTIPGNPPGIIEITANDPAGLEGGSVYTREQINEALRQPTEEERLAIVPSIDKVGHGTALAGIAAGNGSLNPRYAGIAPESELIVVKVGQEGQDEIDGLGIGPRNFEIMLAGRFIIEQAIAEDKPVSILVGFGNNEGGHDGGETLEKVIDLVGSVGSANVVVGTGNQANKDSHTSGMVNQGETKKIEVLVGPGTDYYFASIWKDFIDDFEVVITAPNGEKTEPLTRVLNNRGFILGNTILLVNFSEPCCHDSDEQILMVLDSFDGTTIDEGIWTIEITGKNILNGEYNVWGKSLDPLARNPRFLNSTRETTLTIPSTSSNATSVAASGSTASQIAPFSGEGFTRTGQVKPDITAPGMNIMTTSTDPENRYEEVSGTSAAAAFVAGAYAVLMEYGLKRGGEQFIYGEQLRSYLLRNATRNPVNAPYPNSAWGYGELCIKATLEELRQKYSGGK